MKTATPRTAAAPPGPWLLADIGGTNARFGCMAGAGEPLAHVQTLAVADHAGPAQAARAYLQQLQTALGAGYRAPRAGAWAVATPMGGDHVAFINSGWSFGRAATQAQLQLDTLLLLNDFEALALALPLLQPGQWRGWPGGPRLAAGGRLALAVIGPGTGLGVAGLVPTAGGGWTAVAGEGGHSTLAAGDDFDSAVLAVVRQDHGHVSAERLLSGLGLPLLHRAVGAVLGTAGGPAAPGAAWTAPQIVAHALAGGDATAVRTIDCFCGLLGGFAGNVALLMGARGGLFIGGGIVPRLGEQFFASRFRERFEAKGRLADYLSAIPTLLITDTLAALHGAAHALRLAASSADAQA